MQASLHIQLQCMLGDAKRRWWLMRCRSSTATPCPGTGRSPGLHLHCTRRPGAAI